MANTPSNKHTEPVLTVLDPRSRPDTAETLAPRLTSLDGARIGLLWNNRPRGDVLLRGIERRLVETHHIRPVFTSKLRVGSGAPIEDVKRLSNEVQAVIVGVGD